MIILDINSFFITYKTFHPNNKLDYDKLNCQIPKHEKKIIVATKLTMKKSQAQLRYLSASEWEIIETRSELPAAIEIIYFCHSQKADTALKIICPSFYLYPLTLMPRTKIWYFFEGLEGKWFAKINEDNFISMSNLNLAMAETSQSDIDKVG